MYVQPLNDVTTLLLRYGYNNLTITRRCVILRYNYVHVQRLTYKRHSVILTLWLH